MPHSLATSVTQIVNRLLELSVEDDELRRELRMMATLVLDATLDSRTNEAEAESSFDSEEVETTLGAEPPAPIPSYKHEEGEVADNGHTWVTPEDLSLSEIATRCQLKAEAVRWVVKRREQLQRGMDYEIDIAPIDDEFVSKAKDAECYLWMCNRRFPVDSHIDHLSVLATCFDALEYAASLAHEILADELPTQDFITTTLELLAEAQSALRAAIEDVGRPSAEPEQLAAYMWLKKTTAGRRIYVERYMRLDDPADPSGADVLLQSLSDLKSQFQGRQRQEKRRRKLLGKISYESEQIRKREGDASQHWNTLIRSVDDLVAEGVPPSSKELRERLLPIIDDFSEVDKVPSNVEVVLREIYRYLPTATETVQFAESCSPTPEVQQVARLLKGQRLVLIGGESRPENKAAIELAFDLAELIWVDTNGTESFHRFEPQIAKQDVAVVLLGIRWARHSFGDVQQFCDKYDKPLVRLPSGLNPNQIANQILRQCGERLERTTGDNAN